MGRRFQLEPLNPNRVGGFFASPKGVVVSDSTAAERSLRARIGAYALHSQVDGTAHTQKARDAFLARFETQVDPTGVLPPEERHRRALCARKEYMTRLALKSAKARRKSSAA